MPHNELIERLRMRLAAARFDVVHCGRELFAEAIQALDHTPSISGDDVERVAREWALNRRDLGIWTPDSEVEAFQSGYQAAIASMSPSDVERQIANDLGEAVSKWRARACEAEERIERGIVEWLLERGRNSISPDSPVTLTLIDTANRIERGEHRASLEPLVLPEEGVGLGADPALVATPSSPQAVSTEGFDPGAVERAASILQNLVYSIEFWHREAFVRLKGQSRGWLEDHAGRDATLCAHASAVIAQIRDSGRHPVGENSHSEVEGEACQSGDGTSHRQIPNPVNSLPT